MKCSALIRLLERSGWVKVSKKGSHIKMRHPQHPTTLIIPDHGAQEIGKGLEMQIRKIAGLRKQNESDHEH